ncbi:venom acid phosphatase Acph-1-like [Zophobas morio]|uniref:venom acid phosphatase Acph-1-like n=1 Tax=Zophobas morio TaxID=2755281 RepID=UPI003083DD18
MSVKSWVLLLLFVILASLIECTRENGTSETLILVHAVFRHGDRTPDEFGRYPNDPYKNDSYFPTGSGELTDRGKRREYSVGKSLRKRYNKFLGDLYTPGLLDARSTNFSRTQMSLLLVLAGLFPPTGRQNCDLLQIWQPIPYTYEPTATDKVLGFFTACPNFLILVKENLKSEQAQKISNKYVNVLKHISENAGWNSTNIFHAFILYITLETEKETGRKLPKWTSQIYPQPLQKLASETYLVITGTTKLKQIGAGYLLQKILKDTQAKIKKQENKKLYLYSGHEMNVAFILNTFGVFKPHVPPYGSHILLEIHKINGEYGIKMFYENYKSIGTGLLTISGCEQFCPLDKFTSLVEKYFPDDNVCG